MVALSDRKLEIVRTLVQTAPDSIVGGLRAALQETSGDTVLSSVRQLVEAEAQDRALRNAVFSPIAPLCVGDGRSADNAGFPAQALALIWRGLKTLAPDEMATAQRIAAAIAAAQVSEAGQRGPDPTAAYNALVEIAAAAIIAREPREFRAAAELCDALRPDGARAFANSLSIGPIVRRSLVKLPEWATGTGEDVGAPARLAYKDAAAIVPESGPLFFDMLAAHLNPPWQILRIISAVMDKPNERYLSDSELSSFAERLMDAIDVSLKAITRMDLDGGGEAAIAAARAVELITQQTFELEVSIELSRDHGWGKRILDQKKTLANLVEARLKEAEKLVAAALPIQSDGFSRGRRSGPKLDAAPDGRAVGRALTVLKFVHDVRLCANYGGFSAMHAKVSDKLGQAIDAYVEDVLDHVRTGDVPDVSLAHDHLNVAADLIGLVRDDKATELVRRRAANACSTAKPAAGSGDSVVLDA